jgi:hypothetical protein
MDNNLAEPAWEVLAKPTKKKERAHPKTDEFEASLKTALKPAEGSTPLKIISIHTGYKNSGKRKRTDTRGDRARKQPKITEVFRVSKPVGGVKRKLGTTQEGDTPNKRGRHAADSDQTPPLGFQWDHNSCAYDSILAILCTLWAEPGYSRSVDIWTQNDLLSTTFDHYEKAARGTQTWAECRDNVKRIFNAFEPREFPLHGAADVMRMATNLAKTAEGTMEAQVRCTDCGRCRHERGFEKVIWSLNRGLGFSISDCLTDHWDNENHTECAVHSGKQRNEILFNHIPPLIFLRASDRNAYTLDRTLRV